MSDKDAAFISGIYQLPSTDRLFLSEVEVNVVGSRACFNRFALLVASSPLPAFKAVRNNSEAGVTAGYFSLTSVAANNTISA